MTVTEAGACGTPSVATRIGGHEDAVDDGQSGILVDGTDDMVGGPRRRAPRRGAPPPARASGRSSTPAGSRGTPPPGARWPHWAPRRWPAPSDRHGRPTQGHPAGRSDGRSGSRPGRESAPVGSVVGVGRSAVPAGPSASAGPQDDVDHAVGPQEDHAGPGPLAGRAERLRPGPVVGHRAAGSGGRRRRRRRPPRRPRRPARGRTGGGARAGPPAVAPPDGQAGHRGWRWRRPPRRRPRRSRPPPPPRPGGPPSRTGLRASDARRGPAPRVPAVGRRPGRPVGDRPGRIAPTGGRAPVRGRRAPTAPASARAPGPGSRRWPRRRPARPSRPSSAGSRSGPRPSCAVVDVPARRRPDRRASRWRRRRSGPACPSPGPPPTVAVHPLLMRLAQDEVERAPRPGAVSTPATVSVDGGGRLAGRRPRRGTGPRWAAARVVAEASGMAPPPGAESNTSWSTSKAATWPRADRRVWSPGPRVSPPASGPQRETVSGLRSRASAVEPVTWTHSGAPSTVSRSSRHEVGMSAGTGAAVTRRGSRPRRCRWAWRWASASSSSGCSRSGPCRR